jgi:hypothetical protein
MIEGCERALPRVRAKSRTAKPICKALRLERSRRRFGHDLPMAYRLLLDGRRVVSLSHQPDLQSYGALVSVGMRVDPAGPTPKGHTLIKVWRRFVKPDFRTDRHGSWMLTSA